MSVKLISPAQITVAASGTEQRLLAAPVANIVAVYVSAPAANTGSVYIGDANVSTTRGIEVPKGTTLKLEAVDNQLDVFEMWADVATSGDKLNVSYLQKVSQ